MLRNFALAFGSLSLIMAACQASPTDLADDDVESEGSALAAGNYVIKMAVSGKCLDVASSSTADGAKVQEWSCNGTAAQTFQVTPLADGYYKIINVNSQKSLDITGASTAANALLNQWTYTGGTNQQFKIVDRGNGQVSIHPRHTDMALDLFWGRVDDGTEIVQYTYTGTTNQLWTFTAAGGTTPPAGALPTRLRVTNNCADPIWVDWMLPPGSSISDPHNIKLTKGQYKDYNIPDGGMQSLRFWPKIGCDASGNNCSIGQSSPPCPSTGCQPPIDSKFEASFFAKGSTQNTWYNASQVDGFTLPFKIVPRGGSAGQGDCVSSDAGGLSLARCPTNENISGFGAQDLRVRDSAGRTVGCMSPCKKWNYPAPWGLGKPEGNDPGLHLCCPTPIDPATGQCTVANHCMTSQACSNTADPLSVTRTQYVTVMGEMAPTTYSYAYDDANGLHQCSSTTTFEVTFCP